MKIKNLVPCLMAFLFLLPGPPALADSISRHYPPPHSCLGPEELLARDPKKNEDLLIDLAVCAALNSHPDRARVIGKLNAALQTSPSDARLRVLTAMLEAAQAISEREPGPQAQQAYTQAEKLFQEAAEHSPTEGYVWFERAVVTLNWTRKFSGPEKALLLSRAQAYSLEALKRAPLDNENWSIWLASTQALLEGQELAVAEEQLRKMIRELENTLAPFFTEALPTPAGFVFNRKFVRDKGRSAPAPSPYPALPLDRQRSLLCLRLGTAGETLATAAPEEPFRGELAGQAYGWYAQALLLDPSNLAAWQSIEEEKIESYPYHSGRHKQAWPGLLTAARARLEDPAWPDARYLTTRQRAKGMDEKGLRAKVLYQTALVLYSSDHHLSLAEEREGYRLLKEATSLSPQDLRHVAFWFDWAVSLCWNEDLPKAEKQALAREMKCVLDETLAVNLADLDKVASWNGLEQDSPEEVRALLEEKWQDYYQELEELP